ncbi:MAG: Uma2 family endonuclease [Planctomycetota bacterium]
MAVKAISSAALGHRRWPAPGDWTYRDYLELPDDGQRYEIIWGEIYMMTLAPSTRHQRVSRNLVFALWDHVRDRDLGEVLVAPCDLLMEPGATPVQPDILFITRPRLEMIGADSIRGVPDLLVEILSSTNARHDRVTKYELYEKSGVPEYWIADPAARAIEVFSLKEGRYALLGPFGAEEKIASKVLPGFSVEVGRIVPT